ncbi:MAG TPA: NAD(P)/FAD-dependent oxidoreductase [Steroidobacteraceae bacterium]|jgi:flavin-dependent dehydrogenase
MQTDVLIIGGGPAGSTAATLLARQGLRVSVMEKAHHPRFHIGESLLPANLPLLEKLGVADEVAAIGMPKRGAEFISSWDGQQQDFLFSEAWNSALPMAYHVRRADFDQILFRNAGRAGAELIEGARVTAVQLGDGTGPVQVEVRHEDGSSQNWQARFLIDASGRDTFLANRLEAKHRNPHHNSAAIFGHFSGAERNPGEREGHISIYWFDHGWFWFIPLSDGSSSVGAVVWPYYLKTRLRPVNEFLLETIAMCPPLAQRLAQARLIRDAEATGNYSYSSALTHGRNFILLGDAFAFVDPVFSTGVMLAMQNAFDGAEAVASCLRNPAGTRAALRRFDRAVRHGPRQFSWFIYRITSPTMREMFMGPRNILRMKDALLSMLAGDIFGKTPIWGALRAFKITYHLLSLGHPRRNARARRQRRLNIRPADVGATP